MPGANCVAMIVLLLNVPFAAFYWKLSRIARKFAATLPDQLHDNFRMTWRLSLYLFSCFHCAFDECCSATTPIARRRNLVAEFLVTYIFWPVAFAFALLPVAIFIACIAVFVVPVFLLYVLYLPLKSCWAWCGGESPGAAPSPDNSSAASNVAMVNIAELPYSDSGLEPSSETTNTLQESDTAFSTTRVTMTDDELSPLIIRHTRHIEASVRELRSQMQEMNARSLRTEAQLGELLSRGYSYSQPH
jgi:hypothetical protein